MGQGLNQLQRRDFISAVLDFFFFKEGGGLFVTILTNYLMNKFSIFAEHDKFNGRGGEKKEWWGTHLHVHIGLLTEGL